MGRRKREKKEKRRKEKEKVERKACLRGSVAYIK